MSAPLAAPRPSRKKPLSLGGRLVGVVRRERTDYLLPRRPIANSPLENNVSLGAVPDARRSALVPEVVPDARAVREVQPLVPRERVEPGQLGPPDRRDKGGKIGGDPTVNVPAVRISQQCRVGHVLPLVGEITALNWIQVLVRELAPQLSDDGGPFLGGPGCLLFQQFRDDGGRFPRVSWAALRLLPCLLLSGRWRVRLPSAVTGKVCLVG